MMRMNRRLLLWLTRMSSIKTPLWKNSSGRIHRTKRRLSVSIGLILLNGCATVPLDRNPNQSKSYWSTRHEVYLPPPDDPGTRWLRYELSFPRSLYRFEEEESLLPKFVIEVDKGRSNPRR